MGAQAINTAVLVGEGIIGRDITNSFVIAPLALISISKSYGLV